MINREEELIDLLKKVLDSDIRTADHQFSPFDAYSPKLDKYIELKCRRVHYADMLLEKKKFDNLIALGDFLYICSTPKGVFQWEVTQSTEINWIKKNLPKTTAFGKTQWISKEIGYLLIKDAKVIG